MIPSTSASSARVPRSLRHSRVASASDAGPRGGVVGWRGSRAAPPSSCKVRRRPNHRSTFSLASTPPPPPPPPRLPPTAALPNDDGGGDFSGDASLKSSHRLRNAFVLVGIAAAATVAALPTALSSRRGVRLLLFLAKKLLLSPTATLEVEELSLSWRRNPRIRGVRLVDAGQTPAKEGVLSGGAPSSSSSDDGTAAVVASADEVSASRSLASIVFARSGFECVVTKPFVDLFPTDDGRTTRVARALRGGGADSDDDDGGDDAPDATSGSVPRLPVAAGIRFSAEARASGASPLLPDLSLVVAEGRARVPLDVREALGPSVHAVALVGEEALRSEGPEMLTFRGGGRGGDEEDEDGVLSGASPSSPLSSPYDASWASRWRRRRRGGEGGGGETDLPRRAGRSAVPAAFEVRSEKSAAAADGWLLPSRRRSRKSPLPPPPAFVLRKPAAARASLTGPLVSHVLSRVSPLLADAVAVGEGGEGAAFAATLSPANGVLFPRFSKGVLRVEPLRVELGKRTRDGRDGGGGSGTTRRVLGWIEAVSGSSSPASASSPSLVAWTSPAEIDVAVSRHGGVAVGVRRVDLLVGPPDRKRSTEGAAPFPDAERSARLATWGSVDAAGRKLELTLGVPGETLRKVANGGKFSNVPADAMLCVDVRGTLDSPRVDFGETTRKVAELAALSAAAAASSTSSSVLSHPLSLESDESSSLVSPALAAVKKMFWKKAAEKAAGGGGGKERSRPGSGGAAVPDSPCSTFPWEEEGSEDGAKRSKGRRRVGQIEAALRRQRGESAFSFEER